MPTTTKKHGEKIKKGLRVRKYLLAAGVSAVAIAAAGGTALYITKVTRQKFPDIYEKDPFLAAKKLPSIYSEILSLTSNLYIYKNEAEMTKYYTRNDYENLKKNPSSHSVNFLYYPPIKSPKTVEDDIIKSLWDDNKNSTVKEFVDKAFNILRCGKTFVRSTNEGCDEFTVNKEKYKTYETWQQEKRPIGIKLKKRRKKQI